VPEQRQRVVIKFGRRMFEQRAERVIRLDGGGPDNGHRPPQALFLPYVAPNAGQRGELKQRSRQRYGVRTPGCRANRDA